MTTAYVHYYIQQQNTSIFGDLKKNNTGWIFIIIGWLCSHWQDTFQFKQHVKVNFASDDPFNIYMYILCNISGVKCSPLQSWSFFFFLCKNVFNVFLQIQSHPPGISFLCAPPQLHISANLSTSTNGCYCVLPSISPCSCVFAFHWPLSGLICLKTYLRCMN